MSQKQPTNVIKISNEERILRIMHKVCAAKLTLFLKGMDDSTIVAKGRAQAIENWESDQSKVIVIDQLSEKAIDYLFDKDTIKIEFVMLSTKVIFKSKLIKRTNGFILVQLPKLLFSLERRKASRVITQSEYPSFALLSLLNPVGKNLLGMPIYAQYQHIANIIGIVDLSLGGMCVASAFPQILEAGTIGYQDEEAKIILPMRYPIKAPLKIKWVKKVSEHLTTGYRSSMIQRSYKIGCEFTHVSVELSQAIKEYMQQLNTAKAI